MSQHFKHHAHVFHNELKKVMITTIRGRLQISLLIVSELIKLFSPWNHPKVIWFPGE